MDDIQYLYLDLLNTMAIGLLVVIIAVFYIYLTLEGILGADADDRGNKSATPTNGASGRLRSGNKQK